MTEANGWRERMDRFERGIEHLLQGQAGHDERLTRIEAAITGLASSQKHLLTAQIVLTDRVDKLAIRLDTLATTVGGLAEAQRATDARLSALIGAVDDLVRREKRG